MKEFASIDQDIFSEEQIKASKTLLEHGFDVMRQPMFWEVLVATVLGGKTTPHCEEFDVDVSIWGKRCRAEVKFSNVFYCKYSPIRGVDWSRNVFKWAKPRGCAGKDGADACILIGRDVDETNYVWVVPLIAIKRGRASITITAPSSRVTDHRGRLDRWLVPFDQLLPAFAQVCHNRLDAEMRRRGVKERERAKRAVGEML